VRCLMRHRNDLVTMVSERIKLTQIPGLMTLVFMLFSEVGRDMFRWPTAAHCLHRDQTPPDNYLRPGRPVR
jgi:hypothetical protein